MIKIRAMFYYPPAFLYRIFRIGKLANYIKQTYVFNT